MAVRFYIDASATEYEDCPIKHEFADGGDLTAEEATAVMLVELFDVLHSLRANVEALRIAGQAQK